MFKALSILGGVGLLMFLLAGPALARPFWQSDLTCDLDGDFTFGDLDPQLPRPFAEISYPTGDLYISKIYGLPPGTAFECTVSCWLAGGFYTTPCGTSDAYGTLAAQRIKAVVAGGVCAGVDFFLYETTGPAFCVDGFTVP
jgi:hypothetical protein